MFEYDTPFQRVWPNCPQFVLCSETGAQQEKGLCPVHGSDGCLHTYVQVTAVRRALSEYDR